jgi:hypothetical protein
MIGAPYNFEPVLSDQEFQKIGHLSLKWSYLNISPGIVSKLCFDSPMKRLGSSFFPLGLSSDLLV